MEILSTSDVNELQRYTVLLYGDNRTGKTHFAGTWPRPLFLTTKIGISEMRTLADQDFTVVPFHTIDDFKKASHEISKAVQKGEAIGAYVPRTIVIDNVTTAQMVWSEEIKARRGISKLEWSDWDVVKTALSYSMVELMRADVHVMWITHCRLFTVPDPNNPKDTIIESKLMVQGSARDFLPNHADMLLYAEQVDLGARGSRWAVYGRKRGPHPAGIRLPTSSHEGWAGVIESTKEYGACPCYDQLASHFSLPSVEEDWEAYVKQAEKPAKKKGKAK